MRLLRFVLLVCFVEGVLSTTRRAAVVIDVTNEQYTSVWNREQVLTVIEGVLNGGPDAPVWDAIFDCRNYIYNKEDAAWKTEWTGGVPGSKGAELVPRLEAMRQAAASSSSAMSKSKWRFVGKPSMSCLYDTTMEHALLALKIDELYVMGINTEQCVFTTVVDAWRSRAVGKVFVVEDAITSINGEDGHRLGLMMMHKAMPYISTSVNSTDIPRTPTPLYT